MIRFLMYVALAFALALAAVGMGAEWVALKVSVLWRVLRNRTRVLAWKRGGERPPG